MGKLGKESLINWGSTNKVINKQNVSIFTKRNVTYFVSLFLCLFLAFYFSLEKEDFLVNVNKTTELYKQNEDGIVSNNYILTIHNTKDEILTFDIKLKDEKNYKIKRFEKFSLDAGAKTKKILIIETSKDYDKNIAKTSNITIEIFSQDNRYKITKNISFVHP